jgi:hypothetical protein
MGQDKTPKQGDSRPPRPGDRSGRRFDREVREFVAGAKVPDAAGRSRSFVGDDQDPDDAERRARLGPHSRRWLTVDEIVLKGQSVFERVQRAASNLRARLTHRR